MESESVAAVKAELAIAGRRNVVGELKATGQRLLTTHMHMIRYTHRCVVSHALSIGPNEGLSLCWPIANNSDNNDRWKL